MRLVDLDPRWLMDGKRRVGFTFRCPTKPNARQSCFEKPPKVSKQVELFEAAHGDEMVQPCNPSAHWAIKGGMAMAKFETLSVAPSLDGSRAGLWHGFITNGEIVGGL